MPAATQTCTYNIKTIAKNEHKYNVEKSKI